MQNTLVVGVDIGGTKVAVGLVDSRGQTESRIICNHGGAVAGANLAARIH